MPPNGGLWYYKQQHLGDVWQDMSYVLGNYILLQMAAILEAVFMSRLLGRSMNDSDFILVYDLGSLTHHYFRGESETSVWVYRCGVLRNTRGAPYI